MTQLHLPKPPLQPGELWTRVRSQTQHALSCGALQSIPTHQEWVESGGVRFLVRIVTNLVRKEDDRRRQAEAEAQGKPSNPFLPYNENLCVGPLSETHVCLLNKFNVVDHHLLIITRTFETQESWLTPEDFAALWHCMAEMDGLGFYNAGEPAGASQPHKHLQLIPLPMAEQIESMPIAPLIQAALTREADIVTAEVPFAQAIAPLSFTWTEAATAGKDLWHTYQCLLNYLNLWNTDLTSPPYNLLVTRQWMMIVPRSQSSYSGFPVNSLGFAGALLARDDAQLSHLKTLDPMHLLTQVGRSR